MPCTSHTLTHTRTRTRTIPYGQFDADATIFLFPVLRMYYIAYKESSNSVWSGYIHSAICYYVQYFCCFKQVVRPCQHYLCSSDLVTYSVPHDQPFHQFGVMTASIWLSDCLHSLFVPNFLVTVSHLLKQHPRNWNCKFPDFINTTLQQS